MNSRSSYLRRRIGLAGVADSRTPSIDSLSINFDRTPGGTAITLLGNNFLPNATVLIGGVLANNIVVVDEQTITFTVPPGAEGAHDIEVINFDGAAGILPLGFEYIAGHITKILPSRGLSSGGQSVLIQGVNFVDGSTITFGGVLATGIIFIDSQNFYVTTPSHADGAVDVVITEPGTAVVTARHGYNYTSVVFQGDIRRNPSVQIQSTLGRGVNTANFSIDGKGTQPIGGEKVIFTDGDYLIFAGTVQGNDVNIEDSKENVVWPVRAVDHSARFNRLRPFGVYNNVRATQVVRELVARFAPGFNTTFVQSNLPRISITMDGEQDLSTILTLICEKIGNGNWYLDYRFGVHLFGKAVPPVFSAALTMPPGTAMTVTESTTSTSGYDLVPGYYYFATQGVYGHPKNWTTPGPNLPPASEGYVQLSDEAAALNLLGGTPNGKYVGTSPTHPTGNEPWWKPGWTAFRADGLHYASLGAVPQPIKVAGDYYFASPDVAARLEALIPGHFKTALSPISNVIFLEDKLPNFAAIPVYPDVSGVPCHTVNIFAVRYGDVNGSGGIPLQGYAVVDNGVTDAVLPPTTTFGAPVQGPVVIPFAPPGTAAASESELLNVDASFLGLDCQAGYWSYSVTCVYEDGTESRGSIQSAPILLDGLHQVTLAALPIGVGINGVPVEFRKVYGALFTPFSPLVLGVPDFTQGGSKLVAIVPDNVSDSVTFPAGGSMNGGNRQPYNVPPGMEDSLGPDLEAIDAPEDIDDNSTKLLLDPPISLSRDESQLRNRVYVKGKGTVVISDSQIGDDFVQVADVVPFITPSGGGRVILGSRILEYKSLSTTVGQGVINLSAPLIQPILQSDWLFGGGLPIRPFLQVDDLDSQKERGAIETDENGLPTDGVHEFTISDDKLVTYDQMLQAGLSDLKKHSRPIDTLNYSTRDQLSGVGKMVHVNLTKPPIFGDYLIQEVLIDQYHDESDELTPRYNVTAAPVRMTLGDVLLKNAGASSGGTPSMSGIVASAQFASSGSMPLPINKTMGWTHVSALNYNSSTTTAAFVEHNSQMVSSGASSNHVLYDDAAGLWNRFRPSLTGAMGFYTNTLAKAMMEDNPTFIYKIRTRKIDNLRIWIYFSPWNNQTYVNSDETLQTPAASRVHGFGVKFSSVLGGGWTPFKTPNGDPYQLYPSLAPIAANTLYVIKISVSAMIATIDINGQSMRMPIAEFNRDKQQPTNSAFWLQLQASHTVTVTEENAGGWDFKSFYFERD